MRGIVLAIGSPGGVVDGVLTAPGAIRDARARKPVVAHVGSLAASAAYWLVAQADENVLAEDLSQVGSIGVYTLHMDISRLLAEAGIDVTVIASGRHKVVGVRGLFGSLYLTDLAHKVRRGMQGVVQDGRNAGRRAFGYRPVSGRRGELEIVEEEAEIVRRIFRDYLAGHTPREIAYALNKEGVRPPRGTRWTASVINGNKKRHHGLILNELYAGVIVWNRVRMMKDPDTGRRISRVNPRDEWTRAEVPSLAIIDKELFDAVQQRKADRSHEAPEQQRKAKFLLSGLLKCGCCNAGLSTKDRDHGRVRIHCSAMREAGTCTNRKIFYMDDIERALLSGLQQHLEAPHLLREFAKACREERERFASDKLRRRGQIETRIGQLQRSIDRLWADYESERVPVDIAGPKLEDMQVRKVALQAELAEQPEAEKVIGIHPEALRHYEGHVAACKTCSAKG